MRELTIFTSDMKLSNVTSVNSAHQIQTPPPEDQFNAFSIPSLRVLAPALRRRQNHGLTTSSRQFWHVDVLPSEPGFMCLGLDSSRS
ncbi:hypothetical protein CY34DRAFT_813309 [Suillus luteus UH-Slu-Lm8-n1]|uniref:Uncharacterized protein n=1 Tax=Suillus luteus UH-Slu-Lm8-n1 TaxID=930992 RepID=A0A0D0AHX9_9AGAM|nr:hypothetical protein CY34DRAFT_813309 [Suillus luteus UH-Slu-Lm8-n1]